MMKMISVSAHDPYGKPGIFNISEEDLELAKLFWSGENFAKLEKFLYENGMGKGHHTFSNCPTRNFYIYLICLLIQEGK